MISANKKVRDVPSTGLCHAFQTEFSRTNLLEGTIDCGNHDPGAGNGELLTSVGKRF